MSIWTIVPTCNDPMSCYTVCAFAIMASSGLLAFSVLARWSSNEDRRIEKSQAEDFKRLEAEIKKLEFAINGHDKYIDHTNDIINKIQTELAVQEGSLTTIKADIGEIKALIGKINDALMEMKR